jgi:tetratricopeptide (TPR) repeat protein
MCDSKHLYAAFARWRRAFRFSITTLSGILILSLAAAPAAELFRRAGEIIDARAGVKIQTSKDEPSLELNKEVERELAGGQSHSYQIALVAGQYLYVVVDQRGIDVLVRLFAPGDRRVKEVDSPNGTQGPEPVEVIAEVTGSYRLEISAPQKGVPPAHYAVRIEALRVPSDRDKRRCAVLDSLAEAEELTAKRTPDARRSAILKYEAALTNWRQLGDAKGELATLGKIGEVYDFLGEHQKALLCYEQALPLARTFTSGEQAFVLDKIGSEHLWLGQHQAAQEHYSQALSLWRAAGNRAGEATTLNNIGVSLWERSETERALEQFKQSFEISRSIGDLRAQGGSLNDIGAAYTNLGQQQEAIDNYLRALDLRRKMNDPEGEIETLINIGVLYLDLGETQEAVDYLETALPLAHRLGRSRDEARALRQMGNVYSQRRDRVKALQCYDQALTLDRASSNLRGEGYSLNAIGLVHHRNGDRQKALDSYTQALMRRRDVNDRAGETITLNNIGKVWQELGERQKALDCYSQALEQSRAIARRDTESLVLTNLAGLQAETGNLTEARSTMESALRLVESMRARVVNQELRSSYLASVRIDSSSISIC